ncbi:MAG: LPXTG cell wall anchor domain-containing protein [Nocardioides sp.]
MSTKKRTVFRSAAAATATVLMTMGAMAPALADHDNGKGRANHGDSTAAKADKPAKGEKGKGQDKHKGAKGQGEDEHKGAKGQGQGQDEHKGAKGQGQGQDEHKGAKGQGDERGNGHTSITVCHLLGNGGYNELTFDDNAFAAHTKHGDLYPVPADGCPESSDDVRPPTYDEGDKPGHVRVTVCHLLGNGGYNELSFDEHALRAHEAHGDLYPVPADGCPTDEVAAEEAPAPGTTPGGDTPGDETPVEELPAEEVPAEETDDQAVLEEPVVAGVEEFATTQQNDGEVLGAEATANRAPAVLGPVAGILPQTGAGRIGLAAAVGLGLLGAGATMIARRKAHGTV